MRVTVGYQKEWLELDVPEGRLVADWHGPAGSDPAETRRMVRDALESPRQYPPLHQAVVPGDRVVVAVDRSIVEMDGVIGAVCDSLIRGGVDADAITALAAAGSADERPRTLPERVGWAVHDPDDRSQLAYLASTSEGRRVYLNRRLTDADVAVPVSLLGYDPLLSYRGPWSLLFPDLSDRETHQAFRRMARVDWPDPERPPQGLIESAEVSWLLGSQFHLGVVPGTQGPAQVVAGLESAVRADGARLLDQAWTFQPESRAELVVVGIGHLEQAADVRDVADALANATRLVERGGKIVALSRAEGPIGPALRRVIEAAEPQMALSALRGHESDPDFHAAHQFAQALAWADVYLLSALDQQDLVDSPIIPLERPEQARRLVAASRSCLFLSRAEQARARVAGEPLVS